jgi:hypothetical protein
MSGPYFPHFLSSPKAGASLLNRPANPAPQRGQTSSAPAPGALPPSLLHAQFQPPMSGQQTGAPRQSGGLPPVSSLLVMAGLVGPTEVVAVQTASLQPAVLPSGIEPQHHTHPYDHAAIGAIQTDVAEPFVAAAAAVPPAASHADDTVAAVPQKVQPHIGDNNY